MQLPIEQRGWLAEDLLASLRSDDEREIADEWVELAEKGIPAEEVFARLRRRFK